MNETAITIISLLLLMGAMAKSAQFLYIVGYLEVWKVLHQYQL